MLWQVVKGMAPGVVLGTFAATYLVAHISSQHLAIFFVMFMAYVAIQMFLNAQPKSPRKAPGNLLLLTTGAGIGSVSAVVAISGGTLAVPFLTWHNMPIRKAIGTSAAIGFPIAVAGTIGYLVDRWDTAFQEQYLFGFIYLPAAIAISVMSYFTAPWDAKIAHSLPIPVLKKVFAGFLILLSAKMLLSII